MVLCGRESCDDCVYFRESDNGMCWCKLEKENVLTYEQLAELNLDDHYPVEVIFLNCKYRYDSNFRWCKSIYKGFSGNRDLRFKVIEKS